MRFEGNSRKWSRNGPGRGHTVRTDVIGEEKRRGEKRMVGEGKERVEKRMRG